MNDTTVTVVGNVVDSPRRVSLDNGAVTNFRMASTARRYDAATQQFVDSGTLWVDVECWGALSGNVAASLSKGDPVIVHGALTTHSWESESGPRSKPRIRAFAVGSNLQKGRSVFTRDRSARPAEEGTPAPSAGAEDQGFPTSAEELRRGRDYVGSDETLNPVDTDNLSQEPAHA
ncbi:single-stranded DNA-binding protein [Blastococcus sp. SYSU DS0617]